MTHPIFSLRPIPKVWNDFWHQPCDVRVCALIRICFGLLVVLNFVGAYPWVDMWWSEHGFMPLEASKRMLDPDVWSLFHYLPATDRVLWTCYWVAMGHGALLAIGLFSRFNAAATLVWLITFQHRNSLITDGEDTMFRLICFMLIFMPAWDVWSVDAKILPRKSDKPRHGWPLRMLQVLMFYVLWAAGLEKLAGGSWWSGAAMYYVLHLDDFFGHFPVPQILIDTVWPARIVTWISLWIEILAPVLIWFKETRRWALIAIIALHLGIEYMMNVFLFEWLMICGWLAFVQWDEDGAWLAQVWAKLRRRTPAAQPASA